jgi:hypothetical protein
VVVIAKVGASRRETKRKRKLGKVHNLCEPVRIQEQNRTEPNKQAAAAAAATPRLRPTVPWIDRGAIKVSFSLASQVTRNVWLQ